MAPRVCSTTLYACGVKGSFEDEIWTIGYKTEGEAHLTELAFSVFFNYLSTGTFQT